MASRSEEERPKDWGASEVHDWGVTPPADSRQTFPDAEPWDVHYDLSHWTTAERQHLAQALRDSQVDFTWEDDDLVVSGDYEEYVDEIVGLTAAGNDEAPDVEDEYSDDDADESEDEEGVDEPGPTRPTALDHLGGFLRAAGAAAVESVIDSIPL